jgi:hypothetical protein
VVGINYLSSSESTPDEDMNILTDELVIRSESVVSDFVVKFPCNEEIKRFFILLSASVID